MHPPCRFGGLSCSWFFWRLACGCGGSCLRAALPVRPRRVHLRQPLAEAGVGQRPEPRLVRSSRLHRHLPQRGGVQAAGMGGACAGYVRHHAGVPALHPERPHPDLRAGPFHLRAHRVDTVVLALFVVAYVLAISAHPLRWERWVIPVLPFVALFAAVGVSALAKGLSQRIAVISHTGWMVAVGAALVLPLLLQTVQQGTGPRPGSGCWRTYRRRARS